MKPIKTKKKNNAERQSEDRPRTLLESMADQAKALMLAEAATPDDVSAMAVEDWDMGEIIPLDRWTAVGSRLQKSAG